MQIRKTGAGRGAKWLNDSIHIIEKQARPILLGALMVSVLATLPGLFGPLAMLALVVLVFVYPVLMGGLVAMARSIDAGGPAAPSDVFAAFRNGRAGALMWMAVPQIVFGLVVVTMLAGALGQENLQLIATGEEPDYSQVNRGAIPWMFLVVVFGGVATFSATLFGIPLAMLDGQPGLRAIATSLRASMANLGAVLVYLLCMFVAIVIASVAMLLVGMVLGLILGLLGEAAQAAGQMLLSILLNAGVMAVLACGHLMAWRDVFGAEDAAGAGGPDDTIREVSAEL
ncbi:BPSS1780 family membrane protein [Alkalisalibacterium limincola]|uniref:DUF4013 domain-containing protein n=1 Tax=Alkalisalibacterium limincola TaxID=2699169 RepID=A0A5C8KQJ3_9GAMM|nr:BPSS1780 family membrane protein [Alkalisalibacterium limincola]TXK62235.1 hypothetical protein FU658_08270 [Alkalisalibacterium limincola]